MTISEALDGLDVRTSATGVAESHREQSAIERGALSIVCSTAMSSTSGPNKSGGDYAEWFALPSGLMAIGVWDASGSGVEASPSMNLVRAGLRATLGTNAGVLNAARALNRVLVRRATKNAMPWPFVAGFFATADPTRRKLTYVSCGHEAAVLFSPDGRHRHLLHNSPLLGIDEQSEFGADTITVNPGDVLVVATDGITDARPLISEADFFGSRGLCTLFQGPFGSGGATAATVLASTVAFSDGRLDDDAAVLVARFA
jgi:sigma-B regulation protein RsbU (phosphoserine phosphatase)